MWKGEKERDKKMMGRWKGEKEIEIERKVMRTSYWEGARSRENVKSKQIGKWLDGARNCEKVKSKDIGKWWEHARNCEKERGEKIYRWTRDIGISIEFTWPSSWSTLGLLDLLRTSALAFFPDSMSFIPAYNMRHRCLIWDIEHCFTNFTPHLNNTKM